MTELQTDSAATMPVFDATRPVQRFQPPAAPVDTREGELSEDSAEGKAEAFTPDSADKVDWVLAKIAARRAAAALIRENGEAMAREEEREAEALEWKYGAAIQTWLNAELAGSKSGKKSKRLYHGVVGYRIRPASVTVTNPIAVLAYAKASLPEAVQEGVDKAALAKWLLDTGEVIDGASLRPAEDVFYMK